MVFRIECPCCGDWGLGTKAFDSEDSTLNFLHARFSRFREYHLLLKIRHRDFAHYVKTAGVFESARSGSGLAMRDVWLIADSCGRWPRADSFSSFQGARTPSGDAVRVRTPCRARSFR